MTFTFSQMASSRYHCSPSPRIASPTGDDDLGPQLHYVDATGPKSPQHSSYGTYEGTSERSFCADTDRTYPPSVNVSYSPSDISEWIAAASSPPSSHGHTFSSPVVHPTHDLDQEIPTTPYYEPPLAHLYRTWSLAEQVFGPLLQDPNFPHLYDQQTVSNKESFITGTITDV